MSRVGNIPSKGLLNGTTQSKLNGVIYVLIQRRLHSGGQQLLVDVLLVRHAFRVDVTILRGENDLLQKMERLLD